MVIKAPFSQGCCESHAFVLFFGLYTELKLLSGIFQVIAIIQYSKTGHRWAANGNKRLCSLCPQVSSFMEWVRISCGTFDHGPLLEERSSTTSIILFHNSSNMLNFSRGIRHQLRFLSTMGFLVVHWLVSDRLSSRWEMNIKSCVRIPVKSVSSPNLVFMAPYNELMINQDFVKSLGEWWKNNEIVFDHFMLAHVSNLR